MFYQNNGMTQYDISDVIYKGAQTDFSCVYVLKNNLEGQIFYVNGIRMIGCNVITRLII